MKACLCVLFPSVLALGTIFSGAAASEIGTVTEPACNGEVIVVCGEGLDPKATKIKAFCLGTADGSFRSESLEDGARHAAAIDRQPAVPEVPPAGSLDCEVVGGGPGCLQVVMRCSRQPWISVPAVTAICLQYWTSVIAYPINIGGRPFNSWVAFIPPAFETTILFSAFAAVISMIALNGLPQPYHPVFNAKRFELASSTSFFLAIEAADPRFNEAETRAFLAGLKAREVVTLEH